MRVLFHVEPLVMHGRPFHYWAWLHRTAAMGRLLRSRGWECRWALNHALAARAVAPFDPDAAMSPANGQGLPRAELAVFAQEEIRAIYGAPNVAILDGLQHRRWPFETIERHAALIRERLAGFEPDVIVTYTPSDALRSAYPAALVLHTENGVFSRRPAPATQFFDPLGLYERSMLAVHADALRARDASPGERAWLESFRDTYGARHREASPFAALEESLRREWSRLVLLPLQFGGEAGFDLNAPFSTQGEYLLHVLEGLPEGVGVIACEHPTARWLGDVIDEETRAWLADACPQLVWADPEALLHAGQTLVHHVDAVISVSTSIGLQALVWNKPLLAIGRSHLNAWATVPSLAALAPDRPLVAPDADGAVAWMLRHWCVPERLCLGDAEWLDAFFRRSHARWHAGVRGPGFLDAAEPLGGVAADAEREANAAA